MIDFLSSPNISGAHMCITDLPARTTETCVVYVDGSGKLSCGPASAGDTGDTFGWSSASNCSTIAGCGTKAPNTTTGNTMYGVCAGNALTTGKWNVGIGLQKSLKMICH